MPEDWGWLIVAHRKPFFLWIDCGNIQGKKHQWRCFVQAEPNIFQKLLHMAEIQRAADVLFTKMADILHAEERIDHVRELE